MTSNIDIDAHPSNQPRLFESEYVDLSHIRVRPSEFARMMGCSKQAVSAWLRDGKISLGIDGRLDPGKAVQQLLKNSNPNQLRLKALAPLIHKQKEAERLINSLQTQISDMREDLEFHEGAAAEFLLIFNALIDRLKNCSGDLLNATVSEIVPAIIAWLNYSLEHTCENLFIENFIESIALGKKERGEGDE